MDMPEPTPLMVKTAAVIEHVMSETADKDVELLGIVIMQTAMERMSEPAQQIALSYLTERFGRRN
jgi:hypothetical protein